MSYADKECGCLWGPATRVLSAEKKEVLLFLVAIIQLQINVYFLSLFVLYLISYLMISHLKYECVLRCDNFIVDLYLSLERVFTG